jgi:hypothetical protein
MVTLAGMAQEHMPNRTYTYSDEGPSTGFSKENLFLGGSLGLGFGSYNFDIGVNPEIGYTLNRWLDVGAVVNFNYSSIKADPSGFYNPDIGSKQYTYGGGVFGRAYVLPFLFLTAQPEFNWTSVTQNDQYAGVNYKYNANAPSLLLGIGYGRRVVGQSGFYIALLFDAISNVNSPYNDVYGHPLPVIRAGFDFYLHKR